MNGGSLGVDWTSLLTKSLVLFDIFYVFWFEKKSRAKEVYWGQQHIPKTNAQWLLRIGNPWSLILAKIWFFKHFTALINSKKNDHHFTSNVSMAQLAGAQVESSYTKFSGGSNLTWIFWFFFQIFPNFKGKFWLSGKNRELNILFILIWTHQISVLHRSQPCSLMPSHGHFLTLKMS